MPLPLFSTWTDQYPPPLESEIPTESSGPACAEAILKKYRDKLDAVANKLLEVETLSRDEFESIFPPPVKHHSGTPVFSV